MDYLILFYFWILWLCLGSFINALEYRTFTGKTINWRSECTKCKNELRWYHNIPLFSYLFLKGKCAFCAEKISIQYPIVELLTTLLFLLWYYLNTQIKVFEWVIWLFSLWLFLFSVAYVIVYDMKYKEIPVLAYYTLWISSIYFLINSKDIFDSIKYILMWPGFFIWVDILFSWYITIKNNILKYFYWANYINQEVPTTIWWWDIKMALPLWLIVWLSSGHLFLTIILSYFVWVILIPLFKIYSLVVKVPDSGLNDWYSTEIPFWPMMLISSFIMIFFKDEILILLSKFI